MTTNAKANAFYLCKNCRGPIRLAFKSDSGRDDDWVHGGTDLYECPEGWGGPNGDDFYVPEGSVAEPFPFVAIDDRGVVELDPSDPRATVCGHCHRGWDDSFSTGVTPTPTARCPFEYDHEYPDDDDDDNAPIVLSPPEGHRLVTLSGEGDYRELGVLMVYAAPIGLTGDDLADRLNADDLPLVATIEANDDVTERLEYLRGELRAERMSYGELFELQSLAPRIDPSDVELLEAAGVPEFPEAPDELYAVDLPALAALADDMDERVRIWGDAWGGPTLAGFAIRLRGALGLAPSPKCAPHSEADA